MLPFGLGLTTLDAFDRASENPLLGSWRAPLFPGGSNAACVSGSLTSAGNAGINFSTYRYEPDTCVRDVDLAQRTTTLGTVDNTFQSLFARVFTVGSSIFNGIRLYIIPTSTGDTSWTIAHIIDGTETPIVGPIFPGVGVHLAGHHMGLRVYEDKVEGYRSSDGTNWTLVLSGTTTLVEEGFVGVGESRGSAGDSLGTLNDFRYAPIYVLKDDFNSYSPSTALGFPWFHAPMGRTMDVNGGGQVVPVAIGVTTSALHSMVYGSDMDCSVDMTTQVDSFMGISLRGNLTPIGNYSGYWAHISNNSGAAGGNALYVYDVVEGVAGTVANLPFSMNTGTFRFMVVGNTYRVFLDGVEVYSRVDGQFQCGFGGLSSSRLGSGTQVVGDNFIAHWKPCPHIPPSKIHHFYQPTRRLKRRSTERRGRGGLWEAHNDSVFSNVWEHPLEPKSVPAIQSWTGLRM